MKKNRMIVRLLLGINDQKKWLATVGYIAFFAGLIWCANFWFFKQFGVYEDDFYFFMQTYKSFSWQTVFGYCCQWWPEGRPLGWSLITILAYFSKFLGGISSAYIMGFIVALFNSLLCFKFLQRIAPSKFFAFCGTIAFSLFPAMTTHSFLTHALKLQFSLMCLLAACICLSSGKKLLAYVFSFLILLIYETPFLVFSLIPLCFYNPMKKREFYQHLVIWSGILVMYILVRTYIFSDSRVNQYLFGNLLDSLIFIFKSMINGPMTSLTSFIFSQQYLINHFERSVIPVLVVAFIILFIALFTIIRKEKKEIFNIDVLQKEDYFKKKFIIIAAISFFLCILSYGFNMYAFPFERFGKQTSVHLAAALPSSLLVASVCTMIKSYFNKAKNKIITPIIVSVFFAGLVGYQWLIQLDYIKQWQYMKWLVTQAFTLSPDIDAEDYIFIRVNPTYNATFIDTNRDWGFWGCGRSFFYETESFGCIIEDNPNLSGRLIYAENDSIVYEFSSQKSIINLQDYHIILLEQVGDVLVRKTGIMIIDGKQFYLKLPSEEKISTFTHTPLFELIFDPSLAGQPVP